MYTYIRYSTLLGMILGSEYIYKGGEERRKEGRREGRKEGRKEGRN